MRRTAIIALTLMTVMLAGVVAACGDDDDAGDGGMIFSPGETKSPTPSSEPGAGDNPALREFDTLHIHTPRQAGAAAGPRLRRLA